MRNPDREALIDQAEVAFMKIVIAISENRVALEVSNHAKDQVTNVTTYRLVIDDEAPAAHL